MSEAVQILEELLQTLPPGKLGEDCTENVDSCEHWVHRCSSPEANAILSDEFLTFLRAQR